MLLLAIMVWIIIYTGLISFDSHAEVGVDILLNVLSLLWVEFCFVYVLYPDMK
jgi:TRAP-type C4-dicarboxylate transport system permease small subunit